jgi:putative ABC transport system permease protein
MRAEARRKPFKPRALIGLGALVRIYRRRLRAQFAQELLAGLGIAVAVALVFATLVANTSIAGSAGAVLHEIVGPAQLQLRALGPEGFDESILKRVEGLSAVKQAAPLLEAGATVHAPGGRLARVSLVGGDVALTTLDGLARTLPASTLEAHSLALTRETAQRLRVPLSGKRAAGIPLVVDVRGRAVPLKLATVLGPEAIGPISQALVAVLPLEELQRIALLPHRISRIIVQAKPSQQALARSQLEAVAAGRITVSASDQELHALHQALRPSDEASALFAVIATLLGFLFAFNAVLLTAPERRQAIADFRLGGTRRTVVVEMVLFQAIVLGLIAAVVGALGGYVLLRTLFQTRPGYLARAFTLGGGTAIGAGPLLLALAAGVVASCLASCVPLLDLRRRRALDAVYFEDGEPGDWIGRVAVRRLSFAAAALVACASILFALTPMLALATTALLALASVLTVPLLLVGALGIAQLVTRRYDRMTTLSVASRSLRATTLRSLALVATGVVALFGAVALGGARADLLRGMRTQASAGAAGAQLHITNPGDTEEVMSFPAGEYIPRIMQVPGVRSLQESHGQFVPVGDRMIAVFAHPLASASEVARNEIVKGDTSTTTRRLVQGGWVTVSDRLAQELHLRIGGTIQLPTPTGPARLRIGALTTNLGWPGGAVLMNPADFSRLWATGSPAALFVSLAPGSNLARTRHAILAVLGPRAGLEVISSTTWAARFYSDVNEGLEQLAQITTMLTIAAILAMAAALSAMIWQRRQSLSGLRVSGVRPGRLRRILFAEAGLLLGTGALVGFLAGVYGQAAVDAYLKRSVGFPVATFGSGTWTLETLVAVVAAVIVLALAPGISASRVSPALALAEE